MIKNYLFIPKFSDEDISLFTCEDELTAANVELLKDLIDLLIILIDERYNKLERNQNLLEKEDAVIAGNLIRLFKLDKSFIQNTCERKSEISFILSRSIVETWVNLKYIFSKDNSEYLIVRKQFIKGSLSTEIKTKKYIKEKILNENRKALSIEDRMLISIENSITNSSDNTFSEIPNWPKFKKRCEEIGEDFIGDFIYDLQSHFIHGNWQDIYFNHLKIENGLYKINYNWVNPRPQLISYINVINLEVIKIFVYKELPQVKEKYSNLFKDISKNIQSLNEKHQEI